MIEVNTREAKTHIFTASLARLPASEAVIIVSHGKIDDRDESSP